MRAFAALVTQLGYTRSRNAKVALIADYLRATPDPDRGWALAALTGEADFAAVKSSAVRTMAMERVDPVLFRLSRDFVGDTAETVALIWPELAPPTNDLRLADAVDAFATVTRAQAAALLTEYMDRLDSDGRYALIKLATGAMRVGISARLAKTAFAQAFRGGCRCGRGGLARAGPALCQPVCLGRRRPQARPRRHALFPPVHAGASARGRHGRPGANMPPNGNGTASACRSCGSAIR